MSDFAAKLAAWWEATQLPVQIHETDVAGLFTNPYFLVPFLCLIAYQLYKQAFKYMILVGLSIGIWVFAGSQYMQEINASKELPLGKVLPVMFGGCTVLAFVVYMFFGRSD